MATAPAVYEFLGVSDQESPTAMVAKLRSGLPAQAIENLRYRLELSLEELAEALAISPRTLSRRKKSGVLAPKESDRVYRIARVYGHAVEVFEDEEKAARWLKQSHPALDGMTPLEMFDTDLGAQMVDEMLTRIEFGVFG